MNSVNIKIKLFLGFLLFNSFLENQSSIPQSRLPPMVPNFVGRETECEKIITSLTSESTRHVNIHGSPGFGKTSTAISIGHRLQSKGQPVYFFTFRGINSKNEFISKLLSIFKLPVSSRLTPADELCSFLKGISCRFFLILDNLDDILACSTSDGNAATSVRDDVLKIIEEILMHCRNGRVLTTTRQSLQFLDLKMEENESVKIEPLDPMSSLALVNEIIPSVGKQLSLEVTHICGNVPLAMKLLCSFISDDSQTPEQCLNEFLNSRRSVIDKLDNPSLSSDLRLKLLFQSSFNSLSSEEREAFVSLSIFGGADFDFDFGVTVVSGEKFQAEQTLKYLEKKALIDYNSENKVYSLHPLLQSFAVQKGESELKEVVLLSKRRFYEHYINLFEMLNEQFLTGEATTVLVKFNQAMRSIWLSLHEGLKDETLCTKLFNILAKAEIFLYCFYPNEINKIESMYELAVSSAKRRENNVALYTLLVSKCFFKTRYLFGNEILLSNNKNSEEKILSLQGSTGAKYRCYQGIHALSHGKAEPGIQLIENAFPALDRHADQKFLKILSLQLLTVYYDFVNNVEKSTQFLEILHEECRVFGNLGLILVNVFSDEIANIERRSPCECTLSQHQPLIILIIALLCFWSRDYLSVKMRGNLRNNVQVTRREVEIALPSWDYAIATIIALYDFAMAFLCGEDEGETMDDTVKNIKIEIEKLITVCRKDGHNSESKQREMFLMERLAGRSRSIARQYASKKQSSLAIDMYQQELKVLLELHGELHLKTSTCHRSIGLEKEDLKDYNGALESHQRALDIRLQLRGENDEVTEESFDDVGRVQWTIRDYPSALKTYERALQIRLQLYGEKHEDTAICYSTVGSIQNEMGDHTLALQTYQRALQLRLQLFGEKHEDMASCYSDIGSIQNEMGDHTSALQSHQRALAIRSKLSDDESEKMAESCTNIGIVQECMEDYPSALRSFERAHSIYFNLFGEEDRSNQIKSYFHMGVVQYRMKDYVSALESFERSLKIRLKLHGELDENTAKTYTNIGTIQCLTGDYTSALQTHQRALDLRLNLHGEQHEDVAASYYYIGSTQHEIGNFPSALNSFQRAHDIILKLYGEQHPKTISAYKMIGEVERILSSLNGNRAENPCIYKS